MGYMINVRQYAKFVVDLGDKVAPTDIEENMRVGVDRTNYKIQIPLPPKIDPSVTMMTVEERPDVTYDDVGGCQEEIRNLKEVVEMPLLHPERFADIGIDPPKEVLLWGPPGTGKTLCARAVANRTDACFIRVIGSELVQKYVGEGARMVRELFEMARTKKACLIFFDEIDAVGGARFDDGAGQVGQEGGVFLARPGRKNKHFQNSCKINECRERHQIRAARPFVSQLHRCGAAQRVHRGGHVRHQGAKEGGN